jgi:hypothetical protein
MPALFLAPAVICAKLEEFAPAPLAAAAPRVAELCLADRPG